MIYLLYEQSCLAVFRLQIISVQCRLTNRVLFHKVCRFFSFCSVFDSFAPHTSKLLHLKEVNFYSNHALLVKDFQKASFLRNNHNERKTKKPPSLHGESGGLFWILSRGVTPYSKISGFYYLASYSKIATTECSSVLSEATGTPTLFSP